MKYAKLSFNSLSVNTFHSTQPIIVKPPAIYQDMAGLPQLIKYRLTSASTEVATVKVKINLSTKSYRHLA